MAIQPVLQLGDPRLRMVTEPVTDPATPEVAATINDLRDTLAHWRATTTYAGHGIAAPQIGVLRRIVFVDVDRPWPLINPEIIGRSGETMVVWDACLSFLCIFFQVTRYCWINVRYQDETGEWHRLRAEGELAELLQSTRSTTSTASWLSIASPTYARSAYARNTSAATVVCEPLRPISARLTRRSVGLLV